MNRRSFVRKIAGIATALFSGHAVAYSLFGKKNNSIQDIRSEAYESLKSSMGYSPMGENCAGIDGEYPEPSDFMKRLAEAIHRDFPTGINIKTKATPEDVELWKLAERIAGNG